MAYMQSTALNPAIDPTISIPGGLLAENDGERLPLFMAVPIWATLALVTWRPAYMLFQAFAA